MARDVDDPLIRMLAATRRGDDKALERLLASLRSLLTRCALSHVSREQESGDLAADLTQEALIRIVRSLDTCSATTDGRLISWSLAILQNLIRDYFRGRDAAVRRTRGMDPPGADADHDPSDETDVPPPHAHRVLLEVLREAVATLPQPAVQLLHHRFGSGASWVEVAAEFGCERDAARRRFHRLRDSLRRAVRKRIGELAPEDRDAVLKVLGREAL